MMKKLLALLLAVMLLPAAALAEASRLVVTLTVDEENYSEYIKSSGVFAGADREDELCAAVAQFANGTGLTVLTQDDAFRFDLQLAGQPMLDLSVLTGGHDVIITSDLMDGHGLTIPMGAFDADNDAFIKLLSQTDWATLLSGMLTAGAQTLADVEVTSTRGSFAGDAFTGGVYCDTYVFDDALIAAFVDALLTDDLRALALNAAAYWGLDGEALLASIDEKNEQIASANEHRYIVRIVYDAEHELRGVSATILQGEKQLGTLSIGVEPNALQIVLGFGLDDVNYWHSQRIALTVSTGDDGVITYSFKGDLKEFTADKKYAYNYAVLAFSDIRMNTVWSADLMLQKTGCSWKYASSQQMGVDTPVFGVEAQGLYIPESRLINTATSSIDGKIVVTEKVLWAPCEPIASDGADLTLISLTAAGEDTVNELGFSVGLELAQRLMQVIPMELLLYLQ